MSCAIGRRIHAGLMIKLTMHSHRRYQDFLESLQRTAGTATPFRGTLVRACEPRYANTRDLLTGHGSQKYGGRWNAPGSFPTVYLAQSMDGAIAKSVGLSGYYGFDPASRLPLTLVAADAELDVVFDFNDARLRKVLAMTLTAMNMCDWRADNAAGQEAITQALGRAAFALGAHGIFVPSALKRTFKNLNVFPGNLSGARRLRILGSAKLPRPDSRGNIKFFMK